MISLISRNVYNPVRRAVFQPRLVPRMYSESKKRVEPSINKEKSDLDVFNVENQHYIGILQHLVLSHENSKNEKQNKTYEAVSEYLAIRRTNK